MAITSIRRYTVSEIVYMLKETNNKQLSNSVDSLEKILTMNFMNINDIELLDITYKNALDNLKVIRYKIDDTLNSHLESDNLKRSITLHIENLKDNYKKRRVKLIKGTELTLFSKCIIPKNFISIKLIGTLKKNNYINLDNIIYTENLKISYKHIDIFVNQGLYVLVTSEGHKVLQLILNKELDCIGEYSSCKDEIVQIIIYVSSKLSKSKNIINKLKSDSKLIHTINVEEVPEYIDLSDNIYKYEEINHNGGTHKSPRQHYRKEHVVHRKNGTTYVRRGCTVNKDKDKVKYKINIGGSHGK